MMPRLPLLAPKSWPITSPWRRVSSMTPQALELVTAVGPPDWATTALPFNVFMGVHLTMSARIRPHKTEKNRPLTNRQRLRRRHDRHRRLVGNLESEPGTKIDTSS